ncbi:MAG: hypothetical protein GY796_18965 [Chloroflexi bacterium]|nr:hypothetical protein [Chloroflexota bacterium]
MRHDYNVARLVGTRPLPTNHSNHGTIWATLSSHSFWTPIAYGRLAAILQEDYGRMPNIPTPPSLAILLEIGKEVPPFEKVEPLQ